MKRINSLFLMVIGRAHMLPVMRKLLTCLLIPMGIGLIIGCDTDMEVLSRETLLIKSVSPKGEFNLQINQTKTLDATVDYSGNAVDLRYNWSTKEKEGEIHGGGSSTMILTKSSVLSSFKFRV